MKRIAFLTVSFIVIIILLTYANYWGNKECKKAGGNWISMENGKHCVDNNFEEIDIYK